MAENTGIEWTDHTFNPWQGCSKVSPACTNCYAMELVNRYGGDFLGRRVVAAESGWKKPLKWNREAERLIDASYHNHRFAEDLDVELIEPQRPRVFCASLADIFEDYSGQMSHSSGIPMWRMHKPNGHEHQWGAGHVLDDPNSGTPLTMSDVRRRLFQLIDATPNLDWLLLTKRPENIGRFWFDPDSLNGFPHRPNVWLGTTVENQQQADKRIPELLKCRDLSPVLFLSCEPLLGPVDLTRCVLSKSDAPSRGKPDCSINALQGWYGTSSDERAKIDWVIVGGESGKEARPMHPDWVEDLRRQCGAARVPFFFKQWGEWLPGTNFGRDEGNYNETSIGTFPESKHETHRWNEDDCHHEELVSVKVGKKKAGRLLDGKEYSEFPRTEASE